MKVKRQRKRYEKITKKIIKIFSVILIIGFVVDTVSAEGKVDVKKRSVEVLPICESDKYTSDFEKSDVFYNEDSEIVKMVATDKYINDDKILFDNVSLEENYDEETEQILLTNQDTEEIYNDKETEDDSPDVDFADDIGINQKKLDAEYEIAEINYECSFDMNDLV